MAGIDCGACLTNWSPRLSAAYDLFGTGKTALKVGIGRYASGRTAVTNNPAGQLVVNANRAWADANRNFVPNCDLLNPALNGECGPISNNRFGQATPGTRLADDVVKGVRTYNWQFSAAVQHEVMRNVSLNVGFFRTDSLTSHNDEYAHHAAGPVSPLPNASRSRQIRVYPAGVPTNCAAL